MPTLAHGSPLPLHARLFARPDVWMEGDAVAQFARVASLPGCVRAAAMPDLHAGRGIPVGAAFAFEDIVIPHLVGGDAGCGVHLFATTAPHKSADKLERRARAAMEDDPLADCDGAELFEAVWREGAPGLAQVAGIPEDIAALAALEKPLSWGPSGDSEPYRAGFEAALGSTGGGNHFVEIARVEAIADEALAAGMGLERGRLVALAHSGSRGLGGAIARRWGNAELTGKDIERYLGDLAGACRFAQANRLLLAARMLRALGAARPDRIAGAIEIIHNAVRLEPVDGAPAWVHRKGAAPAPAGGATVVLGSRGAPSWVLSGTGHAEALASVAHGAGRRMGRSDARQKIAQRYRRAELGRTALGGRVVCDDPDLLFEEHPDAYKPIEPVVASLVDEGLALPVASLVPVVTVKQ
ncbi:RtcB family protein [Polyangium aurulentum]|uniref:RtcB family protein n=1 Tax=Polyangium aurulentum TaxID=2567896 RepID=UPI0010AE35DE|nr:RtcB family protein [Polyangium aurulentum]UQA56732.1 RtcB family protein [Polyangium aurulentum]